MEPLLGKPMVGHVYERVAQSPLVELTAVATCDREIFDYIQSIGGTAVMTGAQHERASDRCAEALLLLEAANGVRYDVVVMVQGDEPMVRPEMIAEALEPMSDASVLVTNLLGDIHSPAEMDDRNCIKVVCDLHGNALYFSREPIPTRARGITPPMGKQVCIIPFQRDFLVEYTRLAPTPLEIAESIDMLRILEHGMKVRMVPTKYEVHAVDTPADLARVERLMEASRSPS
jgi:3-deoxy-manno-octulosonate cytidylyltransferase (CMP-KDO synthetase)